MKKYVLFVLFVPFPLACGGGNRDECNLQAPDCEEGLVCEAVQGGGSRCFLPLVIRGKVLDASDKSAIEGAIVQAVDINGAALGPAAISKSDGSYSLTVPATRDKEGKPVSGSYTLRAQAARYQNFPSDLRPALPLDATTAAKQEHSWVLESAVTTILLLPLAGGSGLGSISGTVLASQKSGVLVVAESGASGYAGYSDSDGRYIIFNVPAGSYVVKGYRAGLQLEPANAVLNTGEKKSGVNLAESSRPLSTVNGHVQIVNAPGGLATSVVLAVESTFIESVARGEVPPGLRAENVTGNFTIGDVPDGRYVVLAAYENDQLVRDPDQTIGGTQIVHLQVPDSVTGNIITIPEGFKITEALAVISPGAQGPETIATDTPLLKFENDTSEDGYEVFVYDSFGNQVWTTELGPSSTPLDVPYAGPALEEGMTYQFRAYSFRLKGVGHTYISATEDLKGIFTYQP